MSGSSSSEGAPYCTSPDGFRLEKRGEFGDLRRADATDPDPSAKYFFTGQTWAGKGPWGAKKRGILRAESNDLRHWQGYRVIFGIGPDDPQELEYYTMSVQSPRTADTYSGWYLGFLHVFHTDLDGKRHPVNNVAMSGPVDIALTASRDSINWFLVAGHEPFLPLGPEGSFDSQMIYLESMVQFEDQLYFYYSGWNVDHGIWVGTPTEEGNAEIGLATLPLDRFVALQPTNGHGVIVTHAFVAEGARLELNADARPGRIRVEVLDVRGDPVPGFTEDSSVPIVEDGLRILAGWTSVPDLSRVHGRTIRLRFVIESDAKLYAFRIVGDA